MNPFRSLRRHRPALLKTRLGFTPLEARDVPAFADPVAIVPAGQSFDRGSLMVADFIGNSGLIDDIAYATFTGNTRNIHLLSKSLGDSEYLSFNNALTIANPAHTLAAVQVDAPSGSFNNAVELIEFDGNQTVRIHGFNVFTSKFEQKSVLTLDEPHAGGTFVSLDINTDGGWQDLVFNDGCIYLNQQDGTFKKSDVAPFAKPLSNLQPVVGFFSVAGINSDGFGIYGADFFSNTWSPTFGSPYLEDVNTSVPIFTTGQFGDSTVDDVYISAVVLSGDQANYRIYRGYSETFEYKLKLDSTMIPAQNAKFLLKGDYNSDGLDDLILQDAAGGGIIRILPGAETVGLTGKLDQTLTLAGKASYGAPILDDLNGDFAQDLLTISSDNIYFHRNLDVRSSTFLTLSSKDFKDSDIITYDVGVVGGTSDPQGGISIKAYPEGNPSAIFTLASTNLNSLGQAQFKLAFGQQGHFFVFAEYAGTAELQGSKSEPQLVIVTGTPVEIPAAPDFRTTVLLEVENATTVGAGQPVKFNVRVLSPAGTPSGEVKIRQIVGGSNGAVVGTQPFIPLVNGVASATEKLGYVANTFPAFFAEFIPAEKSPYLASKSTDNVHLVVVPLKATTTDLVSVTPTTLFTNETLKAKVKVTSGNGVPTGLVNVYTGARLLGSGNLDAQGFVTIRQPITMPPGQYPLIAQYLGGGLFSSSRIFDGPTITVKASPTPVLSPPLAEITPNGQFTVMAKLIPSAASGTITFHVNSATVTKPVTNGSATLTQADLPAGALVNGANIVTASFTSGSVITNSILTTKIFVTGVATAQASPSGRTIEYAAQGGQPLHRSSANADNFTTTPGANIGIIVKSTNPALPPTNVRMRFSDGRVVTVGRNFNPGEPPNPLATEFTYLTTIPGDVPNGPALVTVEGLDLEGRPFQPLTDSFTVAGSIPPDPGNQFEVNFEGANSSVTHAAMNGTAIELLSGEFQWLTVSAVRPATLSGPGPRVRIYPIGGLPQGMVLNDLKDSNSNPDMSAVGKLGTPDDPQMKLNFSDSPSMAGQCFSIMFAATNEDTGFTTIRTLRFSVGGSATQFPISLTSSHLSLPILEGQTPAIAILELNTSRLVLSQSGANPLLFTINGSEPSDTVVTSLSPQNTVTVSQQEGRYHIPVRAMKAAPYTAEYIVSVTDPVTGLRLQSNPVQIYWGGPTATVTALSQALANATQTTLSQLQLQNSVQSAIVQLYADPLRFPPLGTSYFLPNGSRGEVQSVNGVLTLCQPGTLTPIVGAGSGAGIVAAGAGSGFIQLGSGGAIVAAGAGIVASGAGGGIVGVGAGAGIVGVGAGIVGVGAGAGIVGVGAGAGIVAAGAGAGIVAAGAGFQVLSPSGAVLVQGTQNGGAIIAPGAGGGFTTTLANFANLVTTASNFPPAPSAIVAGAGIVAVGAGIVGVGAGAGLMPTTINPNVGGNIVASGAGGGIVGAGAGGRPGHAALLNPDNRTDAAKAYDALLYNEFMLWHVLQMSKADVAVAILQARLMHAAAALDAATALMNEQTLTQAQEDAIAQSGTVHSLSIRSEHPSGLITPGSRIIITPATGETFAVPTMTSPEAWNTLGGAMITAGGTIMNEALPGLGIVPIQLNGITLPIESVSPTQIVARIPFLIPHELAQLVSMTTQNGDLAFGTITVDPAQGKLEFASTAMTVNEDAGTATVTVLRTGDSRGALAMSVRTVDDSAKDGVNYTNIGGFIVFNDGDTTPKTFTIPILDDKLSGNGDTAFGVLLDSPINAAIAPQLAMLTVADRKLPRGLIGWSEYAVGRDTGGTSTAKLFNADRTLRSTLTPFGADFTGGVRVAAADFNRDGIADAAVGSGPGRTGEVVILSGTDSSEFFRFTPFGTSFVRGIVLTAGDLTGDGQAELVITAERGGGARIRIFTPTVNGFTQLADFFGLIGGDGVADTKFRGGGRAAVGDINGDGTGDLIFAAGAGGGPRIAIFDGKNLGSNGGPKLRGDFFAFEPKLRDGTYVAAGDFDGDGKAELVAGAGPGGGPRVTLFDGAALTQGKEVRVKDFFAGDVANRGGIRVSVKNLDADMKADLLVGAGPGGGSRATAYLGSNLNTALWQEDLFPGFTGGVFVG